MANALTVVIGLIVALLGAFLWVRCVGEFWVVFKGCVGVTLFFGGLLALAIGWSEMRASREFEAAVPSATTPSTPADSTSLSESSSSTEAEASPAEEPKTEA